MAGRKTRSSAPKKAKAKKKSSKKPYARDEHRHTPAPGDEIKPPRSVKKPR